MALEAQRQASAAPAARPRPKRAREEAVLVWPNLVFIEFISAVLFTITFSILSVFINAPLLNRANLNVTPNPSKAPWYFGNLQELLLHMMRVFYTGAYKPPREFNWVVGVVLLVLTLVLSFTGYLLPWDQLALWAVTVGHGIGGSSPYVGDEVQTIVFGGFEIGQPALIRFYTLHVIALPLLAAIMMAVHFWRIRRDGGMARPL